LSQMPPVVAQLIKGAFLFFPLLAGFFWVGTPLGPLGAAYLALALELLPALSLAQLPLLDEDVSFPRIPVYLSSAGVILLMGWLGLMAGWGEFGLGAMGLLSFDPRTVLVWTVGLILAAFLLLGGFLIFRRYVGIQEAPFLEQLLPETRREKAVFVVLSLSAGLGEEVAYRGFLVPALTLVFGSVWGAALLSSLVFGILHAYQGWLGVVRTALLGMVLAAAFILTGTLWPAILAHALLDVLVGVVFGKTLMKA
jgi:membrane protease YdiL (CAAX protease family)